MGGYTVLVGELGWLGVVWSTAVVSSPTDSIGLIVVSSCHRNSFMIGNTPIFKGIDQDSCRVFAVGVRTLYFERETLYGGNAVFSLLI